MTLAQAVSLNPAPIAIAVCGLALLLVGIWIAFKGFKSPFASSKSGNENPDTRIEFSNKLHWLSEFARNELSDQEMIDELNKVHDRFTLIRKPNVPADSK